MIGLMAATLILFMGCFDILEIDQPSTAKVGKKIVAKMELRTDGPDDNPHHGIVAMKIPNSWEVKKVSMRGDYGRATFEFLPPGVCDSEPGNKLDYWTRSLERIWSSGDDMKWVVYETKKSYKAPEVAFVDLTFEYIVGEQTGDFDIDYLISCAALDFSDPDLYSLSQGHTITVTE